MTTPVTVEQLRAALTCKKCGATHDKLTVKTGLNAQFAIEELQGELRDVDGAEFRPAEVAVRLCDVEFDCSDWNEDMLQCDECGEEWELDRDLDELRWPDELEDGKPVEHEVYVQWLGLHEAVASPLKVDALRRLAEEAARCRREADLYDMERLLELVDAVTGVSSAGAAS